jgi:hypothetical protein
MAACRFDERSVTALVRRCPWFAHRLRTQHGPRGPVPSRPVADASGAPVLRGQGPIGRPGTARPIQASSGQRGLLVGLIVDLCSGALPFDRLDALRVWTSDVQRVPPRWGGCWRRSLARLARLDRDLPLSFRRPLLTSSMKRSSALTTTAVINAGDVIAVFKTSCRCSMQNSLSSVLSLLYGSPSG